MEAIPTALRERSTTGRFEAGETVFRAGSAAHAVYFLQSGGVLMIRCGRAGEEAVAHDPRAGEFIADASLDSSRYHCDVVASRASELLRCSSKALKQLLNVDSAFARQCSACSYGSCGW